MIIHILQKRQEARGLELEKEQSCGVIVALLDILVRGSKEIPFTLLIYLARYHISNYPQYDIPNLSLIRALAPLSLSNACMRVFSQQSKRSIHLLFRLAFLRRLKLSSLAVHFSLVERDRSMLL